MLLQNSWPFLYLYIKHEYQVEIERYKTNWKCFLFWWRLISYGVMIMIVWFLWITNMVAANTINLFPFLWWWYEMVGEFVRQVKALKLNRTKKNYVMEVKTFQVQKTLEQVKPFELQRSETRFRIKINRKRNKCW